MQRDWDVRDLRQRGRRQHRSAQPRVQSVGSAHLSASAHPQVGPLHAAASPAALRHAPNHGQRGYFLLASHSLHLHLQVRRSRQWRFGFVKETVFMRLLSLRDFFLFFFSSQIIAEIFRLKSLKIDFCDWFWIISEVYY